MKKSNVDNSDVKKMIMDMAKGVGGVIGKEVVFEVDKEQSEKNLKKGLDNIGPLEKDVTLTADSKQAQNAVDNAVGKVETKAKAYIKADPNQASSEISKTLDSVDAKVEVGITYRKDKFDEALSLLEEYARLQEEIKKGNKDIFPDHTKGKELSRYVDEKDVKKGKVTKTSVKRSLEDYLDEDTNENFATLAAYVEGLKDAEAAEKIFGKKHADLFKDVVEYINQGKKALGAYVEAQGKLQSVKDILVGLGALQNGSNTDKFASVLDTGGVEAAVNLLVTSFGFKIPKSIEETKESISSVEEFFKSFGSITNAINQGVVADLDEFVSTYGKLFSKDITGLSEREINFEFAKELVNQLNLSEDKLLVIKALFQDIESISAGGFAEKAVSDQQRSKIILDNVEKIFKIANGSYIVSEDDVRNAEKILNIYEEKQSETDVSNAYQEYGKQLEKELKKGKYKKKELQELYSVGNEYQESASALDVWTEALENNHLAYVKNRKAKEENKDSSEKQTIKEETSAIEENTKAEEKNIDEKKKRRNALNAANQIIRDRISGKSGNWSEDLESAEKEFKQIVRNIETLGGSADTAKKHFEEFKKSLFFKDNNGIYKDQKNLVGDDSWGYLEKIGYATTKKVSYGRDKKGNRTQTEETKTDFEKLQKKIKEVTEAIVVAKSEMDDMAANGIPTDAAQKNLDKMGSSLHNLNEELQNYYNSKQYIAGSKQKETFANELKEAIEVKKNTIEQTKAVKDYQEAQKQSAAIDKAVTKQAVEDAMQYSRIQKENAKERAAALKEANRLKAQEAKRLRDEDAKLGERINKNAQEKVMADAMNYANVVQPQIARENKKYLELLKKYKAEGERQAQEEAAKVQQDISDRADAEALVQQQAQIAEYEREQLEYERQKQEILDRTDAEALLQQQAQAAEYEREQLEYEKKRAEYKKLGESQETTAKKDAETYSNDLYNQYEAAQKRIYDLKAANLKLDENSLEDQVELAKNNEQIKESYELIAKLHKEINSNGAYNVEREEQLAKYSREQRENYEYIAKKKTASSVDSLSGDIKKYSDKIKQIRENVKYTEEFRNSFVELDLELQNIQKDLGAINTDNLDDAKVKQLAKSFSDLKVKIDGALGDKGLSENKAAAKSSLAKLRKSIEDIINLNSNMGKAYKDKFLDIELRVNTAKSNAEVEELKAEIVDLNAEIIRVGKTGKSAFQKLKEAISTKNTQFLAMYFSWQDWIRYIREFTQHVVGIDSALTELRKVSDATNERLQQSFKKSSDTALELGQTIQHVINVTADWARLGYDVDSAEELARVTALFTTVGDNMNADDASSFLISTLQGFHIAAEDAEDVVDIYNEVANNFAIDTAGIGEALKRSAASFDAANTSLEKSVALVTATNTVVQDPSSVGTLWKTLSARIRGAKTELEELGEEEDEFTQTTSKLQALVKGLTGFDILEEDGKTFKDIYDIIIGVGKEWKNLTDIEQASLGEALAGKRNANALYAVLNNIETLEKAYGTASDAAGSAAREQENYAKSVQYSLDRWTASVEKIAYDLLDSQLVKQIVEGGVSILDVLDKIINKLDSLPALLTSAASAFTLFKTGGIGIDLNNKDGNWLSLFGTQVNDGLFSKKATQEINSFVAAYKESGVASQALKSTMKSASKEARDFVFNALKARQSADDIAASMKEGTAVGKAFSTTLKGIGSSLLSFGANAAIVLAISALVKVITTCANAEKELAERTRQLSQEYDTAKSDIDKYKSEISSLHDVLKNQNSSYEESKAARERLLSIQDELINKYGTEQGAIENITAAIDNQVDALDRLSNAKWQETLNAMNSPTSNNLFDRLSYWWGTLESGGSGVKAALQAMQKVNTYALNDNNFDRKYTNTTLAGLSEEDVALLQSLTKNYNNLRVEVDATGKNFSLAGDEINGFYQDLLRLQDETKTFGGSDKLNHFLEVTAKNAKVAIDTYGSFYDQYIINEKIAVSSTKSSALDSITKAAEEYKNAFAKGFESDEAQQEAIDNLVSAWGGAMQDIEDDADVVGYVERLYPDIKNIVDKWTFEVKFKSNTDGFKDEITDALELFKDASGDYLSYDDLIAFDSAVKSGNYNPDSDKDKLTAYQMLEEAATKYELSVRSLIEILKEEGEVETDAYQELVSKFGKENIQSLSPDDLEIALTLSKSSLRSFDDLLRKISKIKNESKKTADEISASIVDSVSGVNQRLKGQFDELGELYQGIFHGDKGFSLKDIDNEQLESLRKAFLDLEDERGNKIGEKFEGGKEAVNEFIDVLTSAETKSLSLADQQKVVQKAFNDLATAYFYSAEGLKELNEKTKDALAQQFKKMGIVNADEVIEAGLKIRKEVAAVQEEIDKLDFDKLIAGADEAARAEEDKIHDWGLDKYYEDIVNKTIQTKYGNIDMDKRTIIRYNDEILETFKEAMSSWNVELDEKTGEVISNYYKEIAEALKYGEQPIDTVFGGQDFFKLDTQEIEVAFSPILVDENGQNPQFLSQGTVFNYIQKVLNQADAEISKSGQEWSEKAVIKRAMEIDLEGLNTEEIDSQGRVVGKKFVHGIIAGIGEESIDVDKLMHFSGEEGAWEIANDAIEVYTNLKEKAAEGTLELSNLTAKEISVLQNEGVISEQAAQSIARLALQKQLANQTEITTNASVQALAALAQQAGIDIAELVYLKKVMDLIALRDSYAAAGVQYAATSIQQEVDKLKANAISEIQNALGEIQVGLDFAPAKADASKGGGDAGDAYVEAYEKELQKLDDLKDQGLISEKEYLERLKALIDKYFKDRAKYAEKYAQEMQKYMDKMLTHYNSVISGITTLLDRRITAANKGKDAAIKALQEEQKAAEEAYQAQIDALQAEIDAIDEQIDALDDQIDGLNEEIDKYQDMIDAINEANDAREREINLQKAQYELQRAQNQRTKLVKIYARSYSNVA